MHSCLQRQIISRSVVGSRVISAQKANTANAFSLDGLALSTANLYRPFNPAEASLASKRAIRSIPQWLMVERQGISEPRRTR